MILLLTFIFSLILWYNNKRVLSVALLFFITCNGLNLKYISNEILPIHNYLFLFSNLVLIQDFCSGTLKSDIRNNFILKILVYGYLFFIVHCILTILLGIDNFRFASSVLRTGQSSLLLYFIVRKLNIVELEKTIKIITEIILIHCLLYLLQLLGINLFFNEYGGEGVLRNGTPASLPLFILITIIVYKIKRKTFVYLLPLIFGEARGVIVAMVAAFFVYYRKYYVKIRYFTLVVLLASVLYWGYDNYLAEKSQRYNISMLEEIAKGFDWETITDFTAYDTEGSHFTFKDNGTFAFRISMILERVFYLISNPVCLPFGVGAIAEDSPYNHFNFFIGTEQENLKYGFAQIDSVDVVWSSVVLRYGLAGIIFWILLLKAWYNLFDKQTTNPYFKVGGIYVWFFIFNSFGSTWVIHASWLLPFFLITVYCQKKLRGNCL